MFNKLMCKLNPTVQNIEKELLNTKFEPENVKSILDSKNVDINDKTEDGLSFLHLCLMNNRSKAAQWLIQEGIDIDVKNSSGISAVRYAVEKGDINTVKTMTATKNFNIDQRCKSGRTLLQDAVLLGHQKVIHHLLNHNINVNSIDNNNRNVLFDAIDHGDEVITKNLVENTDVDLNLVDNTGQTILHDQHVLKSDELAAILLENGADPTICDKDGNSFLTHTALRGKEGEAILELAIKCGADLNKKVAHNNSILMEVMYAFTKISDNEKDRRSGLKSVASKLINHGLHIDAINDIGESVIFDLIRLNDIEGCAFLLEKGLNPNLQNNLLQTPLYISILGGIKYIDITILLLQYSANPLIKDKKYRTIPEVLNDIILHVHDFKELEDKLILDKIDPIGNYMLVLKEILSLNKKVDFTYLDSTGDPLFFKSFLNFDIDTTRLYLQYGLDINTKNIDGYNLFYAYTLQAFERQKYYDDFRNHLVFLLVNKSNINHVNKSGQNICTKIASMKECSIQLFKKLTEVTKQNYSAVDNMGRTIVHYCVISSNTELMNLVYSAEKTIHNIADSFNILPVTYAALFGNLEIVEILLKRNTIVKCSKPIHKVAKLKFKPLIENLDTLINKSNDLDTKRQITILVDQIRTDFK
ncbi:MAG: ankyrin repeat domain-containing protein [Campylobacterota bacterium]|nr:ankyrin repeat domain-containing protein [Campylobacterota bacterium]